jgi:hypothetical protein
MSLSLNIRTANNGFIISWQEESSYEEDTYITREAVFEYDDESFNAVEEQRKALSRTLNAIVHHFDCGWKKYAEEDEQFIKIQMISHKDYFSEEINDRSQETR